MQLFNFLHFMLRFAANPDANMPSDTESDTRAISPFANNTENSSCTDDSPSSDMEVKPLLSQDAFQSPQSSKLFKAIDELWSCGANRDIDLPEVYTIFPSLVRILTDAARHCRRSVGRKIVTATKPYRHSLPRSRPALHSLSYSHRLSADSWCTRYRKGVH